MVRPRMKLQVAETTVSCVSMSILMVSIQTMSVLMRARVVLFGDPLVVMAFNNTVNKKKKSERSTTYKTIPTKEKIIARKSVCATTIN